MIVIFATKKRKENGQNIIGSKLKRDKTYHTCLNSRDNYIKLITASEFDDIYLFFLRNLNYTVFFYESSRKTMSTENNFFSKFL